MRERVAPSRRGASPARGGCRLRLGVVGALCVVLALAGCPGNKASVPDVTCAESELKDLLAEVSSRVVPPLNHNVLRDTAASIRRQPARSLGYYVLTVDQVRVRDGTAAGFKLSAYREVDGRVSLFAQSLGPRTESALLRAVLVEAAMAVRVSTGPK